MRVLIITALLIVSLKVACQTSFETQTSPIIELSLKKIEATSFDSVWIQIRLTNNTSKEQQFLFDKPTFYTGGLWLTFSFDLRNEAAQSVLSSKNRALLASSSYRSEEELKNFYYKLKPGQSIMKQLKLAELVSLQPIGEELKKGKYFIQLSNGIVQSNIAEFTVL